MCYNEFMEMIKQMAIYEVILFIAIGLAVLLFGYRIKKIAFFIIWFLLGFNLMMILMPHLNNMVPDIANSELWQNLLPIASGLLLALLGFSIEKICVAGICFALVMIITVNYFGTELVTLAVGAIIGVVAAASAVTLMKPAIIIAAALAGAYALTIAALTIFSEHLSYDVFYFPLLIGLTVIGSLFQFSSTKHIS